MAACVAALAFFSSCGPKDDTDPSVDLLNTNGVIDIKEGGTASFGYKVEKGTSDIQSLKVTCKEDGKTGLVDLGDQTFTIDANTPKNNPVQLKDINAAGGKSFTFSCKFENAGKFVVAIEAIDKDGKTASKTVTINVEKEAVVDPWKNATSSITADGTYLYKQGNTTGKIVVSKLTTTSVTVKLDDYAPADLGDAANQQSWLLNDGKASSQANAVANPSKIVCAKISGKAEVGSYELTKAGEAGLAGAVFIKFIQE